MRSFSSSSYSTMRRVKLTQQEKDLFKEYAELANISLRQLVDSSIQASLQNGSLDNWTEIVLPSDDASIEKLRTSKALSEELLMGIDTHMYHGKKRGVGIGTVIVTAIWNYIEAHPIPMVEPKRKLLFAQTNRKELKPPKSLLEKSAAI